MTLFSLGWDDAFARQFSLHAAAGLEPARVVRQHRNAYALLTAAGELAAELTGKLLHRSATPADLPVVGDWVAVRVRTDKARADIHDVLPRRTAFSRRAAGARTSSRSWPATSTPSSSSRRLIKTSTCAALSVT